MTKAIRSRDRDFRPLARATIVWEHKRIPLGGLAGDHPFFYDKAILEWCRENTNGSVFLRRYDRFTHKLISRDNIIDTKLERVESYGFIRGNNDFFVRYMDLEFASEGDCTLFLLVWLGRVDKIDAIPFPRSKSL